MRKQKDTGSHRRFFILSFLILPALLVNMGGCAGGCEVMEPLPAELPPSQTIEGGLQVRITEGGLERITAEIPVFVEAALQNFQVPPTTIVDASLGTLTLCPEGCQVNILLPPDGVSVEVTDNETLTLSVSLIASTALKFRMELLGFNPTDCTFTLNTDPAQPLHVDADIGFFIRESDGELRIEVQGIRNVSVAGLDFGVEECGFLTDVLDFFAGVMSNLMGWLDSLISSPIAEWLTNELILPWLQPYIDDLIPSLGVTGQIDIGAFIADLSPGTSGKLETRMAMGGYVNLFNKGMTLGVITGLNSDDDPETRERIPDQFGVMAHSEPARCVPPFSTFSMEPYVQSGEMTLVPGRETYSLGVTPALNGTNDSNLLTYSTGEMAGETADVGVGVSEHFLNLAGFHAINSGALCVSMGTEQMDMLTVGLIGILVESLTGLINNNRKDAPMKVVVRPQWPAQFAVGEGTEDDPLLDLYLRDFRVDLYPFVEERYTRALTLALDMHVGMNMETQLNDEGQLVVVPTLMGVDEDNVVVRVHNSHLVAEDPAELEATLPQVMGLIMPLLTSALGEGFPLPELGNGLSLNSLEFKPNTNNTVMLVLASIKPSSQPLPPMPVRTMAKVVDVKVPPPESIREGIIAGDIEDLPSVALDVGVESPEPGVVYEWQYRLGERGLWRPFTTRNHLVIRERAFSFQGWHSLYVRARKRGAPLSQDRTPQRIDVLLDSTVPILDVKTDGVNVVFKGFDMVTVGDRLRYSYCRSAGNWSEYSYSSRLSYMNALGYARACDGRLGVRVKDEAGNVGEVWSEPTTWMNSEPVALSSRGDDSARGCSATGSPSGVLPLVFAMLALLGLMVRRKSVSVFREVERNKASTFLSLVCLMAAGVLLSSACSKSSPGGENNNNTLCEDDDDCMHMSCPDGLIPACKFGRCECVDDILFGRLGMYSSLVVVSGPQAYISAYNRSYGDLMVGRFSPPGVVPNQPYYPGDHGWEFVDGVPDAPVMVPNSDVRGGIRTKGENVGTYTSIGVNSSRHPVVAYHDETHGDLKFAWYDGSDWHHHMVDDGGSDDPEVGRAGLYNKIIMRKSDRAPGILYMAPHVSSADPDQPIHCELRFAQAKMENPSTYNDWIVYVIDRMVVQPQGEEGSETLDWEKGVGVHPSAALKPDGTIVVAYFDSVKGNLMMSEMVDDGEGVGYFSEPVIVDGEDGEGRDNGKVGLFVSVAVDPSEPEIYHFTYTDPDLNNVYYYNTAMESREIVDDGYRMEDNEETGLPMPVFHQVGWDAKLIMGGNGSTMIFYQDSTNHELRLAKRVDYDSDWTFEVIAGGKDPFNGAYGFSISLSVDGTRAFVSSYVINEHAEPDLLGNDPEKYFVEIFEVDLGPG